MAAGSTMATMWKFTADFMIPPALVLTVLIMLPLPMTVRKGLIIFTRRVLFFEVFGGFKLVHFMQAVTLFSFIATSLNTYRLNQESVLDDKMTPNMKTSQLAKKWREERNFWIAVVAFLSWVFVGRSYALLVELVGHKEQIKTLTAESRQQQLQLSQHRQQLEEQQAMLREVGRGSVPPPVSTEASAPLLPEQDHAQKKSL
mmetsp:Transcript_23546/g.64915  ORF Transcript_23546/g.64915 Transcript_23546/m.64915 type:complete len:201 (-) Transcript_23546:314-916(-)